MKNNYSRFLLTALIFAGSVLVRGQTCTAPPAPTISGTVLAACTSSANFTLTANTNPTNTVTWMTGVGGGSVVGSGSVFSTPTLTSNTTYYAAATGAASSQTLTMPTHNSSYPGNVRGYWFQAPVAFVITGVWVPTDVGTGNASAAVIKMSSAPPAYPTTLNSFTTAFLAQNVAGVGVMATNIAVQAGEYIGVLGQRGGSTSYGTSPFVSSLGTHTMTIARFGMQYGLATTAPQDLWTEAGGSVGRVFLYTSVGCQSSLTPVTVSVMPNPLINIAGPTSNICTGSSATLNATGMQTYAWQGGPSTASYVVSPNTTTTYTVNGSAGVGCSTVAAITVTVDQAPPVVTAISSQSAVCDGNTVTLSGAGGLGYTWTGGVTDNVPFTPTATASYTVSSFNGCGPGTAIANIVVNPNPVVNALVSPSVICEGETSNLSASGALSYSWSPEGQTGANIAVTPSISTAYVVVGTNTFGCFSSAQQVVIVNPTPTIHVSSTPSIICTGGAVNLHVGGNATTYSWSTGANSQSTVENPLTTSIYTATGLFNTGCLTNATVEVTVFQPTIAITGPTAACLGTEVTLTGGPATSYTWSTSSPFSSITFTAATSGIYQLSAHVPGDDNTECIATNSIQITVNPLPDVTASASKSVICKNEKVTITAGGAETYTWHNNATTSTISITPKIDLPVHYTVTGSDENGCTAMKSGVIIVNACLGLKEENRLSVTMFPNPSSGDLNFLSEEPVEIEMYDQTGRLIAGFELMEENNFAVQVQDLAAGLYFVTCKTDKATQTFKAVIRK